MLLDFDFLEFFVLRFGWCGLGALLSSSIRLRWGKALKSLIDLALKTFLDHIGWLRRSLLIRLLRGGI